MNIFNYLGGLFLGWSVGANDSANMFGTAVASRMVRYRTAVLLIAVGVVAGAVLQGHHGIETVSSLSDAGIRAAVVCTFAAAGTVTLMSLLKIPVSTSQMMISAVVGLGLYRQNANLEPLAKIVLCWVLNPVGAMLVMKDAKLADILTDRDYLRDIAVKGRSSRETPVSEIMTRRVIYVAPESTVDEALTIITEQRIRHLPVLRDHTVVGVISIGDLVKAKVARQEVHIKTLEAYIADEYPGPQRNT